MYLYQTYERRTNDIFRLKDTGLHLYDMCIQHVFDSAINNTDGTVLF
jgi:hypothetical protein